MKKIILSMLLVLVAVPTFALVPFKGFVEQVVVGELDPHVVGDSCILMVRTPNEKLVGLVNQDFESCQQGESLEDLKWKWVSVLPESTEKIKDKDVLKTLRENLDKNATYLSWNGERSVLDLQSSKIKRVTSEDLKPLAKLGRKLVKEEIGGNAGALDLHRADSWSGQLTSEDILRQLLYSKGGGEFLEEVTIETVGVNRDELDSAVENIVSQDSGANLVGHTKFRENLLNSLVKLTQNQLKRDFFEFFTGSLGGRDNYSTNFLAVLDGYTGEWVILIQGYSE